jgi:F0F1-type ATP synthase alpha subunit
VWLDAGRLEARLRQSQELRRLSEQARARAQATREQIRQGRSRREILRDSAFARLRARQETIAVIEQAKGILMARQGCGPDEAFELLRRASQRANVKVHVLAAQIVEQIVSGSASNVTPVLLGAQAVGQSRPWLS